MIVDANQGGIPVESPKMACAQKFLIFPSRLHWLCELIPHNAILLSKTKECPTPSKPPSIAAVAYVSLTQRQYTVNDVVKLVSFASNCYSQNQHGGGHDCQQEFDFLLLWIGLPTQLLYKQIIYNFHFPLSIGDHQWHSNKASHLCT